MKERPILFSAEMVRALIDGHKTQTRRVVKWKPLPGEERTNLGYSGMSVGDYCTGAPDSGKVLYCRRNGGVWHQITEPVHCPYGAAGDRLWVRETWMPSIDVEGDVRYAADYDAAGLAHMRSIQRWRPSIHMPRRASRITLEVADVRVERIREIALHDTLAEGIRIPVNARTGHPLLALTGAKHLPGDYLGKQNRDYMRMNGAPGGEFDEADWVRAHFAALWDNINGGGSWEQNPWVWVVTFRRIEA